MFQSALEKLPDYLGQHVLVSLSSILLGLVIALPLAFLSVRVRALRGSILGFASVIQTIPGIALLALFYPLLLGLSSFAEAHWGLRFRALGFLPAFLALAFYAILPVLRNTIVAIIGIDPAIKTAARAVGMTERQALFKVELPIAAPIIMAGIRTAAVWVIGAATLSTPVGQTSLGNYIFTGLQTENWTFVLFGCVAAALLAMVVDRLLALAETGFATRSRARLIVAALGLALVLGASLAPVVFEKRDANAIVIGTKGFDESYVLGALIGQTLDAHGIPNIRRDGLGSTVIFRALREGDVDVYVDYSGTIWANHMQRGDAPGRDAVLRQMGDWLNSQGIGYVGALGFENAYAFAMRRDRAEQLGVKTLDDLRALAPRLSVGADTEFFERPDWKKTEKLYGLKFGTTRQYQSNFLYKAVADKDVDVIVAYSSDGRIAQLDLVLLGDPKGALPPYDAVLLVSKKHARDARLLAALKPLVGAISLETMQKTNLLVSRDEGKMTPNEAATVLRANLKR